MAVYSVPRLFFLPFRSSFPPVLSSFPVVVCVAAVVAVILTTTVMMIHVVNYCNLRNTWTAKVNLGKVKTGFLE